MNKKIKTDAKQEVGLKRINTLYHDLDKRLPTVTDFFIIVMMNGFGENVNLKQLYPNLYTQVEDVVKEIMKNAAKNPHNSKTMKMNKLSTIYQHYLKTEMKHIPKGKN